MSKGEKKELAFAVKTGTSTRQDLYNLLIWAIMELIRTIDKRKGDFMKLSQPDIVEPLEKGRFLYSAVEAQEQGDDLESMLFQADEIEAFDGSNLEFKNCVFRGVRMFRCSLEDCFMTDVLFESCDISNLKLGNLSAQRVRFEGCKMVGVQIPDGLLQNVSFVDCNCRYANLSNTKLKGAKFDSCFFQDASLDNWNWKDISFHNCDLTRVNLCHTPLKGLDLRNCQIDAIVLTGSELKGAIVTHVQALDLTRFLGIEIR